MAKRDAAFTSGRVGNLIYYQWKGIPCVRTIPYKVRQTKATRQSAKNFGRAVKLSQGLRGYLSPCLPNYKSKAVMHTMNAALLTWLRQEKPEENISFVGLEFNEKSTLTSKLKQQPIVDFSKKGKILISFPRLKIPDDLLAPSNTTSVRMDIAAVGFIFSELFQPTAFAKASVEIPYKKGLLPAVKGELAFNFKPGSLNVIAMSLHYITSKYSVVKEIADERWTPSAIIAAQMT
jgi:hypothetical protein